MTVKSLLARVGIDTSEFEAGMKRSLDSLKAHQKTFTAIGGTMTAIGGIMTAFFAKSISEAAGSEAAQAKLSAALLNVKGAAKDGAEKLIKYSEALQQNTGIEDDEIVKAQALLATFGLNEKQIAALTPRVLDMAVAHSRASGEQVNLTDTAMSLGRAMTGHMELLGRQGVVLSEQTKKTGDLNLMVKDLDKAFGGAAAAAGQTFAGQMNILKLSVGDVMKGIGKELLPVLLPLVSKFKEIAMSIGEWIEKHQGLVKTLVPIIAGVGALNVLFGPMVMLLPKIAGGFNAVAQALLGLKIQAAVPIMITVGIVGGVALAKTLEEIREFYEKNVSHKYIAQEDRDWQGLIRTLGEWSTIAESIHDAFTKQNGYSIESGKILGQLDTIWQKYGNSTRQAMEAILRGEAGPAVRDLLIKIMEAHGGAAQAAGIQGKATETLVGGLGKLPPVLENISTAVAAIPFEWDKWNSIITIFEAIKNAGSVTFSFVGATSKSTVLKLVDDIQYAKEILKKLGEDSKAKLQETFGKISDVVSKAIGPISNLFGSMDQLISANRDKDLKATEDKFNARTTALDQTYAKEKATVEATAANKRAVIEGEAAAKAAQVEKDITNEEQKAAMLKNIELQKQEALNALDAETKKTLKTQEDDLAKDKAKIEGDLAKEKERIQKEAGKAQKKIALITAAMNIAEGITKALSGAIPPWNFILAGITAAAGAVQLAAIKATSFATGGYVDRPTFALIGEKGPEVVLPVGRFGMAPAVAGAGAGSVLVRQTNFFYGDIRTAYDIDEISEKLAKKTQEAIQRGRR